HMRKILLTLPLVPILFLAKHSSPTQPALLIFRHVTIIDMTGAPPKPDMSVVVAGTHITQVGRVDQLNIPKGAQVVDASGKFMIPGLWDMHFHFHEIERSLLLLIANGVTGVRDIGNHPEQIFSWRDQIATGKLLGPRIVACGPLIDGNPPANAPISLVVTNEAEARAAVRTLKSQGAEFLKVYDRLSREAYFAIAAEAKKQQIPFVGHVPVSITTIEASNTGQQSIEHLGSILEGCSAAETELRNWPQEPMKEGDFSAFPRRIAARGSRMLDTYDEIKCLAQAKILARNQTWQVPTLITKEVQTYIDDISKRDDPRLRYSTAAEIEASKPQNAFLSKYRTPEYIVFKKRLFASELSVVGLLHRAGVPFMVGTDAFGSAYVFTGFSVHDELALFVRAGFTPMEALQAATRNPANFLGELSSQGTIEPGKLANLVLLEANPLEDINNSRKIWGVALKGRYFSQDEIHSMLASVAKLANP
ncbi:MAG TPA: amidohydrolase family protein, partial [Pyrinomonadaceae bacterium]|nr:amidohydrolase family protein [Pyrinomonadaceae bacterium]